LATRCPTSVRARSCWGSPRSRVEGCGTRADLEPARFDRAVPRWHARLCGEQQLSSGEAQLALAALNALPGPGVQSAAQSLAAVCETHGLGREVQVLQTWLSRR
jgi:hypothetical protein